ncbi:MAG: chemotaxis-specific protein-glutamate methyltransferase CheB [Candidatus Omnitrophica bacterium]|nr:chemotaxis-specific protein-glutamate methyltransferase CheB [Candidatus Omnitrophota bacterium]
MESKKIRVLVVDDSTLMREAIRVVLDSDPLIEVVGVAQDGEEGVAKALTLKPDVITMDMKMPIMSGLEAIEKIMEENPIPIIVVSSSDVKVIVHALSVGAMDFVSVSQEIDDIAKDLLEKVKIASRVKPIRRMRIRPVYKRAPLIGSSTDKVVAIGISTGGPQALQVILSSLPVDLKVSIIIVQHMSAGFIPGLIEWLRPNCQYAIREAKAGETLQSRVVFFAPDHFNLTVDSSHHIVLKEDVSRKMFHVPNVDEMLKSVALSFGKKAIGVLMTGMGQDGVEGMMAIKRAGGVTIAQDEGSSVIFGMNQMAIKSGCVDKIVPLDKMSEEIYKSCQE